MQRKITAGINQMRAPRSALLTLLWLVLATPASADVPDVQLMAGTRMHFADVAEARAILTRRDGFIRRLSPFDRAARVKTASDVSEAKFIAFVGAQARAWEPEERLRLTAAIAAAGRLLAGRKFSLPPQVLLIKTTGNEEGHAAYHRGTAVVLPQKLIDRPPEELRGIILHELFHVFTHSHPERRERLYRIVGFRHCGKLQLPPELDRRRITNPDAYDNSFCMALDHGGRRITVFPVLLSTAEKYDAGRQGEFFDYLQFRLLAALRQDGDWIPQRNTDGTPTLFEPAALAGFMERIGANTRYIIHPEEILADNFVLLLEGRRNLPTPRIPAQIEALLRDSLLPTSLQKRTAAPDDTAALSSLAAACPNKTAARRLKV